MSQQQYEAPIKQSAHSPLARTQPEYIKIYAQSLRRSPCSSDKYGKRTPGKRLYYTNYTARALLEAKCKGGENFAALPSSCTQLFHMVAVLRVQHPHNVRWLRLLNALRYINHNLYDDCLNILQFLQSPFGIALKYITVV